MAPSKKLRRTDDKTIEDCKTICEYFLRSLDDITTKSCMNTVSWALGKRHIFLTEGARQHLELQRIDRRHNSATLIQALWRGWHARRRWPALKRSLELRARSRAARPRPQPITCTPPPEALAERCDHKTIQQTCNLFGLDLERPPPVPPSRSYTISGNQKMGYPQTRIMKMPFTVAAGDDGMEVVLVKGDTVMVVGASGRRGHLMVEMRGRTFPVPHQYMDSPQPAHPPPQAACG